MARTLPNVRWSTMKTNLTLMTTTKAKLADAAGSVGWIKEDQWFFPPNGPDDASPVETPKNLAGKTLRSVIEQMRADVGQAVENLLEVIQDQQRDIEALEQKFERFAASHRHQNGPGTWTGKPEA